MTNPLWDYSLAHYSLDGVAATCLELQDDFGLDVNVLLYGAWLATMDQRLCLEHLAGLEAVIATWREAVVAPLRALRRQWRSYPEANDLRDGIKALELRGEQRQQDMMLVFYRAAGQLPRANRPLRGNLALVAQFANPGQSGPEPAIGRLAALLQS